MQSPLPRATFLSVVKNAPLVAIDLVCRTRRGEVLLGYRRNLPAKDYWFVPGGRIRKDERFPAALKRIVKSELGLPLGPRLNAQFLGIYEHLYRDNFSGAAGIGTHYLVLAYRLQLDKDDYQPADTQHAEFRWFRRKELLSSPQVHPNTKAYFLPANVAQRISLVALARAGAVR